MPARLAPSTLLNLNGFAVALLLMSTASASPAVLQARGRRYLGGISMTFACAVEHGDTAWKDVLVHGGAGCWKCRKGDGEHYEWRDINVNAAYTFQYNESNAYAANDKNDAYTWGCFMD